MDLGVSVNQGLTFSHGPESLLAAKSLFTKLTKQVHNIGFKKNRYSTEEIEYIEIMKDILDQVEEA